MPDPTGAVLAGRAAAERLMLDAGTALRPTGETAYDPATQTEGDVYADLFTSPCKIQSRSLAAREEQVAGRTATSVRVELHLPASTEPLTAGDVWEVTTPHSLSVVPAGRRYRILAPFEKGLATARRYEVEVMVS